MKSLLIALAMAMNTGASVDGTWESPICEGTFGRGMYGTYNYQFNEGKVETFFRQYQDFSCTKGTATVIPQAQGTYFLDHQAFSPTETYRYIMSFPDAAPLSGMITINEGVMQICQTGATCWSFHKR